MHKTWMIVRREYRESVRKKSFWIGTLVFPLIMGLLFAVPIGLSRVTPDEQKTLAVVDLTERLAGPLRDNLADRKLADGRPRYVIESLCYGGGGQGMTGSFVASCPSPIYRITAIAPGMRGTDEASQVILQSFFSLGN